MIVKVQLSIASTGPRQVLIYDQKRSIVWQGAADDYLLHLMADRPKAFFDAVVVPATAKILINHEVEAQAW